MRSLIYRIWFDLKARLLKDDFMVNGWTKEAHLNIQKYILDVLRPQREDCILEFGCGTGLHCSNISNICKKIIGVDYSKNMIIRAQYNNRENFNVEIVYCKTSKLSFKDNSFDKVFSWSVFEYLPTKSESENLLREFYRITKPDGLIFIGDIPSMKNKNNIFRPVNVKNFYSILNYLLRLLNYSLYLYFDPYKFCKLCKQNFGDTIIINQSHFLPGYRERFDILIKVVKRP